MKTTGRTILIVGILVVFSLACQTAGEIFGGPTFVPTFAGEGVQVQPTQNILPAPTEPAAPTLAPDSSQVPDASPVPQDNSEGLVFVDDFSNPDSGWVRIKTADGRADYINGGYAIAVEKSNQLLWSTSGQDFTNVRVQVNATFIAGSEDNNFGVVCRYQDEDNFYAFVISSDGYFAIRKRVSGEGLQTIIGDNFQFSERILLGGQTNTIMAECVGSQLSLFVNGEKVAETTDADLTRGDVGLIAGTFSSASTEVLFDNFSAIEIE
jgi:hypothetical protein